MEYEIIDVHLHLCKDTATEKLAMPRPGIPDSWLCGTPETLPRFMDFWGVSKVISLNAHNPNRRIQGRLARLPKGISEAEYQRAKASLREEMAESFRQFNDWGIEVSKRNPRIQIWVGIDPIFGEKTMDYFEDWVKRGTGGIKIHPGQIGELPDHPFFMPIYQRCQELGLPVVFDTGSSGGPAPGGVYYGEPNNFIPLLSTFPKLKLIMAHFCSLFWDERIILAEKYKDNLFFDIGGGLYEAEGRFSGGNEARDGRRAIPREDAVRIFRKVGVERLMFASDGTGDRIPAMAEQIMSLELTDEEKSLIFSGNAKRILGL